MAAHSVDIFFEAMHMQEFGTGLMSHFEFRNFVRAGSAEGDRADGSRRGRPAADAGDKPGL